MIPGRFFLALAVATVGCAREEPTVQAKAVWLPKLWEKRVTSLAAVGDRIYAEQPSGMAIGSEDGGRTWHGVPESLASEFASDGQNLFGFHGDTYPPSYRRLSRRTAAEWEYIPFPPEDGRLFGADRKVPVRKVDCSVIRIFACSGVPEMKGARHRAPFRVVQKGKLARGSGS
ncbi:MAG: hypothetical protein FJZ01_26300 [Candidatus Sericytochromatia bacterium]|nr:hypothetical protein [Candidatus Tanganyikabacteria bacterium]